MKGNRSVVRVIHTRKMFCTYLEKNKAVLKVLVQTIDERIHPQ